jgi:hypothetical protein
MVARAGAGGGACGGCVAETLRWIEHAIQARHYVLQAALSIKMDQKGAKQFHK